MSEPKLERCMCNPLNDHWCDRTERALAETHVLLGGALEALATEGVVRLDQSVRQQIIDLRTRLGEAEEGHEYWKRLYHESLDAWHEEIKLRQAAEQRGRALQEWIDRAERKGAIDVNMLAGPDLPEDK